MLKIKSKAGLSVFAAIYILQVILLGLIIALSVTGPQNNLFPWQMAMGTALGTILLLTAFFLWDRIPCKKIPQSPLLFTALLTLYGILLYTVSCIGRNAVWSSVDYGHMWNAALELSEGKDLSAAYYFKTYANNIKPMLYLSALFRISTFLHIDDPFYFILIFSVLETLGAVWSVTILAGNSAQERAKYRIPVLLMFVFTLPIWANVQAFYTDSMSFMIGIIALALFKLSMELPSRLKTFLLLILAGILTGIGMSIKITVLIPVIAGFILFCASCPPRKKWGYVGVYILGAIAAYESTSLWAENYAIWNAAKETSEPIIDWIALGMKGNGSYTSNLDYIHYVTALPTKQEKIQYTVQYIWENRSDFWNPSHLAQKIRCNFASGHFGTKDFTYYALKEHNPIWEIFSPWGKYYWRTSQLCFCYIFSIYTVYMLGAAASFYSLIRKKELSVIKAIADLSLLGTILFLMIWEANNRQLYNQIPVIILGAVLNARQIVNHIYSLIKGGANNCPRIK